MLSDSITQFVSRRRAGVFAIPIVDQFGVKLAKKWYDAGVRVFIGHASTKNTSGKNPAQDLQAYSEWKQGIKALGPDAYYICYPWPDWKPVAVPAPAIEVISEIKAMVADPQCLGFLGMDEPNIKDDGKTNRVDITTFSNYWRAIMNQDLANTKLRLCDFAGNGLTAAWGYYTGDEMKPYCAFLTDTATNWHEKNANAARYGNDLLAKAIRMLGRIAPPLRRWAIMECADEQISSLGKPGGPDDADMDAKLQFLQAEDPDPVNGTVKVMAFFPAKPRNGPDHIFDNTTQKQFAKCADLITKWTGARPDPGPIPFTQADFQAMKDTIAAQQTTILTLTDQVKDLHSRLSVVETRSYKIVPA